MNREIKVAIVTGAGTGIGKAVAQILLKNDYCVTLTGRRAELLDQAAQEVSANEDSALCVAADIRLEDDIDRVFDMTVARFGRIDLLFNNAGVGAPAVDIDELDVEHWRAVMETNIHGAVMCARRAFGQMKKQ
ncbi:MAG: SDR family NAD(P)-dependent oxidoreductase, partial [Gammaproteobacteria bacterium]